MNSLSIEYLGYFGPNTPDATLPFYPGVNVICGSSETGKSFVVESIDFMLGQEDPVRDIPEKNGYDLMRLTITSPGWPPMTLDRSIEGGHFLAYNEFLVDLSPKIEEGTKLRYKHSAARQDTLSYSLLERIGLTKKWLRKNKKGDTRSLSFRDLARLCLVTEGEIQGRGSPLLTGQYVTAPVEYSVFKLLLTGTDDSALVSAPETPSHRDETGKIELLDQMIDDIQAELDEEGAGEEEIKSQLSALNESINYQNRLLSDVQVELNAVLDLRGKIAKRIKEIKARLAEIAELIERFNLLDSHYQNDLNRLEAIHESGSLFVHLEKTVCPLCGANPTEQHLEADCQGNTEAVVNAAKAELTKINHLRRELNETTSSLTQERNALDKILLKLNEEYMTCDTELTEIVSPKVSVERSSYDQLVSKRAELSLTLDKITRLKKLLAQRTDLEGDSLEAGGESTATKTLISKNVLDAFAQKIENILEEWHFPYARRVFFDENKRDIVMDGKERGSTGKGLRAITHAAVKIGLMEFCIERGFPHPGFIVLDSPLLAYWKPEGTDDDLRGTDLKERFYRYLLGLNNQIIIIENEHPPAFVFDEGWVTVFTKNIHEGRYGFFPVVMDQPGDT